MCENYILPITTHLHTNKRAASYSTSTIVIILINGRNILNKSGHNYRVIARLARAPTIYNKHILMQNNSDEWKNDYKLCGTHKYSATNKLRIHIYYCSHYYCIRSYSALSSSSLRLVSVNHYHNAVECRYVTYINWICFVVRSRLGTPSSSDEYHNQ